MLPLLSARCKMSNFEYTPSKNYDLLVKQFRSMAQLVRALEAEGTMLKKHVSLLENQLALSSDTEINALREANEQLTGDLLAKEVERDALKAELGATSRMLAEFLVAIANWGR